MTTTISLDRREVFSISSEMDIIHNHLRISHSMVLDQLCECSVANPESMEQMHERIFFLVGEYPKKLAEMMALNEKLMGLVRAEKLAA